MPLRWQRNGNVELWRPRHKAGKWGDGGDEKAAYAAQ